MKYDAIICGAGPAGSTCAYHLSAQGLKVIIFDKKKFPRYKPCGGGLTGRSMAELGGGWDKIVEDTTREVIFYHRHERPLSVGYSETIVKMISRDKLDSILLEKAASAGAVVYDGCEAVHVEEGEDGVTLRCRDGSTYRGEYLVGADGARSIVRKALPFPVETTYGMTVECELPAHEELLKKYRGQIRLNYGVIPNGYGWVFPKKEHLSVGIGSFTGQVKSIKKLFNSFCSGMGLKVPDSIRCYGAVIPCLNSDRSVFNTNRTLIAGDAAGLVDPFTGEGIFYALRSGRFAAQSILSSLSGQGGLDMYTRLVGREIISQLDYARRIAKVVYSFTPVVHRLVAANPEVARKLVSVLFGTGTYQSLWRYLTERYVLFRLVP